jgi:hypothetical protein
MPAHERAEVHRPSAPAPHRAPGAVLPGTGGLSVRDLLASCAAATAVSTPPRPASRRAPAPEGAAGTGAAGGTGSAAGSGGAGGAAGAVGAAGSAGTEAA